MKCLCSHSYAVNKWAKEYDKNEDFVVVGRQLFCNSLNTELEEKSFVEQKIHVWLNMVRDSQRPVKWGMPSKEGTKIDFEVVSSPQGINRVYDELETYLAHVNHVHGTAYRIERE